MALDWSAIAAAVRRFGPFAVDAMCRMRARQLEDRRHGEDRRAVEAGPPAESGERRAAVRRRGDRRLIARRRESAD